MKQLNLWHKERSDVIHEYKNQIAECYDVLRETSDLIQYSEHIDPLKGKSFCGMEYEDYVDIKKNDLKGFTYDQILLFLKNLKPQGRIDKFKKLLKSKKIPFKADLWIWHNKDLI